MKSEYTDIVATSGKTYAEQKTDLLHQLGFHNVKASMFDGLNEYEIDRKARDIISPPIRRNCA